MYLATPVSGSAEINNGRSSFNGRFESSNRRVDDSPKESRARVVVGSAESKRGACLCGKILPNSQKEMARDEVSLVSQDATSRLYVKRSVSRGTANDAAVLGKPLHVSRDFRSESRANSRYQDCRK